MAEVLLDTHVFYWMVSGEKELLKSALVVIGASQDDRALLVSPITAWELAIALNKKRVEGRPNLGAKPSDRWFRDALRLVAARVATITPRISYEAAKIVSHTGHKDPADCFLMATARIRQIPLVTRDAAIQAIAAHRPGYLQVIPC